MTVWDRIGWTDPDRRDEALYRLAKAISKAGPLTQKQVDNLLREPYRHEKDHSPLHGSFDENPDGPLTGAELVVLRLAAAGRTDKEIAALIGFSTGAVQSRIKRVLAKLQAKNRTHAVAIALRRGLII